MGLRHHVLLAGLAATAVFVSVLAWPLQRSGLAHPRETRSPVELRLAAASSSVAGFPVDVACWPPAAWQSLLRRMGKPADAVGLARTDGTARVDLAEDVCAQIDRLWDAASTPGLPAEPERIADALTTLGHETRHLMLPGGGTEAQAECLGMQTVPQLAVALGANDAQAIALATLQWQVTYPHVDAQYRSPECRDGGQLDLDPFSYRWP